MEVTIDNLNIIIVAVLVLALGRLVNRKAAFLEKYNIPYAVTGGILCSLVVLLLAAIWNIKVHFDLQLRDLFLLFFFSTIGLGAKLNTLAQGGKMLVILTLVALMLLVAQNLAGIGIAMLSGNAPGYGLLAGSVSFAGGHGTAIAWGQVAADAGLKGAAEFGVACATFGLIAGGLVGGPVGGWLIGKYQLQPAPATAPEVIEEDSDKTECHEIHIDNVLGTLLALSVCVTAGNWVNEFLAGKGLSLPGFLTAMMVGIIITNVADTVKKPLNRIAVDRAGELSLQLFLAMSLMSMDLMSLMDSMSRILVMVTAQVLVVVAVAVFVVFRVTGKNYDSAIMASGFCGLGLGATPVAIANMTALTSKFGPSVQAFLVIPLIGAFFIDLLNAVVIKFFIALPFFSGG
ncbi:sodium/glutamate symporter [Thiolapillus brandeum]|uniref:Sodium/glutamate symporter n=1 Tax=Thiolapillus brandeum TaxID=1076588 RepID=A0A7U6JJE9_9GAMM|nr:sodium/glutamate symporter [Thiolapillus brandeum]BAO45577.1 glutamate:Na+ symporter ESS family [Thiolapillus brandeum]